MLKTVSMFNCYDYVHLNDNDIRTFNWIIVIVAVAERDETLSPEQLENESRKVLS